MTPDLHDATLADVRVDWAGREAALSFHHADRPIAVAMHGCSGLVLPRQEPWGPSSSVNSVTVVEAEGGGVRLEVEMQSGDTLVVDGDSLEWTG